MSSLHFVRHTVAVILLSWSLGSSLGVAYEGSFGFKCQQLLEKARTSLRTTPISGYAEKDWLASYQKAKEENNVAGGTFALTQLLWLKRKELNLAYFSKFALKNLRISLYTTERKRGENKKIIVTDVLKNQVSDYQLLHNSAKIIFWDFLWSFGPSGYRLVPDGIAIASVRKLMNELQLKVFSNDEGLKILGVEKDEFLNKIEIESFSKATSLRRSIRLGLLGKVYGPVLLLIISGMIGNITNAFSGDAIYPHPLLAMAHQQSPLYLDADYIDDIQKNTQIPFQGKKISFISEKHFVSDALAATGHDVVGDINAFSLSEYKDLKNKASEFHAYTFESIAELNEALSKSSEADVVVIAVHGLPGDFAFNRSEYISEHLSDVVSHVLKSDALLIFVSCSFGDKFVAADVKEQQETWVQLSKQILGEKGKAVASTSKILLPITTPSNSREALGFGKNLTKILISIPMFWVKMAFIGPVQHYSSIAESQSREYARGQPKLRIYDAEAHQVTLHAHGNKH